MRIPRRKRIDPGEIQPDNILWGVPRREGYSDTDDPLGHEGLVQHAFLMGNDERALCGFVPPRRLSRADKTPRAQLALPGPANPRCRKCEDAVAESMPIPTSSLDEEQGEASAGAAEPVPDEAGPASLRVAARPRAPAWKPRAERKGGRSESQASTAEDAEDADERHASHPRTRVRRGGIVTVPAGRQSVVAELPASDRGAAIAAEIDGEPGETRVQSVSVRDDGTMRITLNQRTPEAVDVMWFVVSPPRG